MKKRYRIKSKARFAAFLIVCLMLLTGFVSTVFGASPIHTVHAASAEEYVEILVENGDTLWKIARDYGPSNVDTRIVVYNIERVNGVSPDSLIPGQTLLVPVSL